MKNEFVLAFNEVLDDKQLPHDVVMEALEAAMISAYRKAVNASNAQHVMAKINPDTGEVSLFAEKEVVDEVHDHRTEVALENAQQVDPEAELGGMVVVETTPRNFGRVAAQTARQVIQQRIREAERDAQFKYFGGQVGEVVNGIVQASNPSQLTLGLDKKAEGVMPRNQQIGGERFRVHDRVRALLLEVKQTPRGPQIILSRAHRNFLRRLLEDEVPEIYHGLVEIRSIAREPGQRSKVAVSALQLGIDPVGACVGVRGVRIQAIVRELNDEKIDVIEWNADATEYIAKALSPARVNGVYLDRASEGTTKTATVVVPEDQLSLAIGRDGQNARLAAKLTGWRIDIKSLPEAAGDALYKLQNNAENAELYAKETDIIPQIELIKARKMEGRPLAPEEYQVLAGFVDRVERRIIDQREEEKQAEKERRAAIRATIPSVAFDTPLEDLGISPRYTIAVSGEGFSTIGELLFQLALDSDVILGINGIGPKAMEEIEGVLEQYKTTAAEEEARKIEAEAKAKADAEKAAAILAEAEAILAAEKAAAEAAAAETGETTAEIVEAGVVEEKEEEAKQPETAEKPADVRLRDDDEDAKPEVELDQATIEEMFKVETLGEYVEDDDLDDDKKKSRKRKKQFGEVIYDEDADFTYVKRKRKRDGDDWEVEW